MLTTLYLIRHGVTEANLEHLMQGSSDQDLCEMGKAELPYLTEHFRDIPVDAVYASHLKRAKQTAKAVADAVNLPILIKEDLRERDAGEYEGWPVHKLIEMTGIQGHMGGPLHPAGFDFPTAEPVREVYARVGRVLSEILDENRGKSVVIVSHGMTLQMALAWLMQVDIEEYCSHPLRNSSVTKALIDEDNRAEFAYIGDMSFLPQEMIENNERIGRK